MNYLKGLKQESVERLADLWKDENFQDFVRVLRLNQENCAKLCLTRNNMEEIVRLQEEARAYSLVIRTVEDAYLKVNKIKRRKQNAN